MRARTALLSLIGLTLVAAGAQATVSVNALRRANAAAVAAERRAAALDARADAATSPAARARLQQLAVAARVAGAEAEVAAGRTRSALIGGLLAVRRAQLATDQGPVTRLLAALSSVARRPATVTLVQPGSIADLVHVQAVLATTLPVIRDRTAAVRAEVARTRALQDSAGVAARSLDAGRARLVEARERLAALDGTDDAATERALALGEEARDTIDRLRAIGGQQATLAELIALPGPPVARIVRNAAPRAYRLPVAGRLVTGMGEVSDNGVRARGLTLAVAPGARVVAPAAGRVVYARRFRSFGNIVVIDHGDGWTTLITGLGTLAVVPGTQLAAGAAIARAPAGEGAQVTVELRRGGRPMDIAQLIG